MPKFGLLGTVMYDEIRSLDGQRFESFGGILYNVLALAAVADSGDRLVPFSWISEEHLARIGREYLDALPAVDRQGLRTHAAGTDTNSLVYVTASSRREVMNVVAPEIHLPDVLRAAPFDALLINFISGHEFASVESFAKLREATRGPIYLDMHNLGKLRKDGVPVKGHRFSDWPAWFACVDIVQGNEWEAERMFDIHPTTEEEFREVTRRMLAVEGPKIALLTLGGEGCAVGWRAAEGGLRFARIPAMPNVQIVDTTGCGDSFSAAFLTEYLRTQDPLKSAVFAATLSGMKCQRKGLDGLRNLSGARALMASAYGELLARIEGGWRGGEL